MTPSLTPLSAIKVEDRQRQNLQDIESLAESLARYGLIQPIVLDANGRLIAGGRRLAAARLLGWTEIPSVNRDVLDSLELAELEYEENCNRADLTWQERVLAVDRIHKAKCLRAAKDSTDWGAEKTGVMFGIGRSHVGNALAIATALRAGDDEIVKCDSITDAIRLLAERKLADASKRLLALTPKAPETPRQAPPTLRVVGKPDCVACGGTGISSSGKPCTCATTLPSDVEPDVAEPTTGVVTAIHADAIGWLRQQPDRSIKTVYTDPPYATDMAQLDQSGDLNSGSTSLVAATHDVDENALLLDYFTTELARVLNGYAVIWCDQAWFDTIKEWLELAGLRVQRWPLVWVKRHTCKNGAPFSNFCKATEIALVAAVPGATLAQVSTKNWCDAAQDSYQFQGLTNPFWKPIALHQWIISTLASPGETIVDPFAGCGSIPLAAKRLGYNVTAVECDEIHLTKLIELCGAVCKPSQSTTPASPSAPATSPLPEA